MNIDRLKQLADAVEKGVVEFPNLQQVVAFTMGYTIAQASVLARIPDRTDIPDPSRLTSCGCIIGITVLLFGTEETVKVALEDSKTYTKETINLAKEAELLLDLTYDQAFKLFYGRLSSDILGKQAARVIRNLILTEKVDWSIIN